MSAAEPLPAAFSRKLLIRLTKLLYLPTFGIALLAVHGGFFLPRTCVALVNMGTILMLAAILPTNRALARTRKFFMVAKFAASCIMMERSAQLGLFSPGQITLLSYAPAIAWIASTLIPARLLWPAIRLQMPVRSLLMHFFFSESGLSGLSTVDAALLMLCLGIAWMLDEPCRLRLAEVLCTAKLTTPLNRISPRELEAALRLHAPHGADPHGEFLGQVVPATPSTWIESWPQLATWCETSKLNDALSWTTSSFTSHRSATPHTAESARAFLDSVLFLGAASAMQGIGSWSQGARRAPPQLLRGVSAIPASAPDSHAGSDADEAAWAAVDAAADAADACSDAACDAACDTASDAGSLCSGASAGSEASEAGSGVSLAAQFGGDDELPPVMAYTDASYGAEWRADAERRAALRNRRHCSPLVDRAIFL